MDPTRKDGGLEERPIELRILFYPRSNQYKVSGPHDNSTIFLAMLEMAKVNHYDYRAQKNKGAAPLIQAPNLKMRQV